MRIICDDYYDYYDVLSAREDDLVYLRKQKEIPNIYSFPNGNRNLNRYENICTIGVGGKIYGMIAIKPEEIPKPRLTSCIKCYFVEDVDKYMESICTKRGMKRYHESPRWGYHGLKRKEVVEYFETVEDKQDDYQFVFDEIKAPVFLVYDNKITVNPHLKPLEFYRVLSTEQCFQQFRMWVGNQAPEIKPIPKISDKTMVEIKGFDKYSFRQPPKD